VKVRIWLILLFMLPFSALTAQDALSILESLPPPQVEYKTAPANSYPTSNPGQEKILPTEIQPPPEKSLAIDTKKIIEQVTPRPIKSLANVVQSISSPPASETRPIKESTRNEVIYQKPAEIQATRVKVVEAPSKAYQSFRTLQKNSLIAEWQAAMQQNLQLFTDCIELSQKIPASDKTAAKEGKESEETEDGGEETTEETGDSKSFDSVFAKVKGLQKKEKWKDIIETFEENPDAAETKEGLEFILEASLNQEKPDVNSIRRNGNSLLKLDKKNAWGNYAMAYYYYNSRKPNATKGAQHLDTALKAKKPPPGASKLYWMTLLKKLWIVGLLLLGAIIGGINHVMKKKKAAQINLDDISDASSQGENSVEAPTEPSPGLAGKLKPLLDKLQPILDKIRRKKPQEKLEEVLETTATQPETTADESSTDENQAASEEIPAPETTENVDQPPELPDSAEPATDPQPEIPPPPPDTSEEEN